MTMRLKKHKLWYRLRYAELTYEAKLAKILIHRICIYLEKKTGYTFSVVMDRYCGDFEGHIMCPKNYLVFWGGHFSIRKYGKSAISKAWVSLLEDCLGIGELGSEHALDNMMPELFSTGVMLNCKSQEELEVKLVASGC